MTALNDITMATDTMATPVGGGTPNLYLHTPVKGGTWSGYDSGGQTHVFVGQADTWCDSNSGSHVLSSVPVQADVMVSADITQYDTNVPGQLAGVIARAQTNATTFYFAEYSKSLGGFRIGKKIAGGTSQTIGSVYLTALPAGVYHLVFTVVGTTLTLWVDNKQVLQQVDTDISAAGKIGLRLGGAAAGPSSGMHVSNYNAYYPIDMADNGELSPAYFTLADWTFNDSILSKSPTPLFMPISPGVPGATLSEFPQLTTSSSGSQPDYTTKGANQHIYIDGRTLTRPDPMDETSYISPVNSFQFLENPAPRSYQIKGGAVVHWRNFHMGGNKQTQILQTQEQYFENMRFTGSTTITAWTTGGPGATRQLHVQTTPYPTTMAAGGMRVFTPEGTYFGHVSALNGNSGGPGTYTVTPVESGWPDFGTSTSPATIKVNYIDGDGLFFQGDSTIANPQPSGMAQACIIDDIHGLNRDHYKTHGSFTSGENCRGCVSIKPVPNSQNVDVELPGEMPGEVKVYTLFNGTIVHSGKVGTLTVNGTSPPALGIGQAIFLADGTNTHWYVSASVSANTYQVTLIDINEADASDYSGAMIATAYQFIIGDAKINGAVASLNAGLNTTYNFVSYNPSTKILRLRYDSSNPGSADADPNTGVIWALSGIAGEHGDPVQEDKDRGFTSLYLDCVSATSNYNNTLIARNSATADFPITVARLDSAIKTSISPIQDSQTECMRIGTTALQNDPKDLTVIWKTFVALRDGAHVADRAFPSVNDLYPATATNAIVDGVSREAVRWDINRPKFKGIAIQGASPGTVRYGRMGAASDHNGFDAPRRRYSGQRKPASGDLGSVLFLDTGGVARSEITLSNSVAVGDSFGRFKLAQTLPPGFHIVDGYVSFSGDVSTGLKVVGNNLRKAASLSPGSTGVVTLKAALRVSFKATMSGNQMTVTDVVNGYLAIGTAVRGPGISGAPTITAGPTSGLEGTYTLSTAQSPTTTSTSLLATSDVTITQSFSATVTA